MKLYWAPWPGNIEALKTSAQERETASQPAGRPDVGSLSHRMYDDTVPSVGGVVLARVPLHLERPMPVCIPFFFLPFLLPYTHIHTLPVVSQVW